MLEEIIAELRYWYRRLCYWRPLRIGADQQLRQFLKNDLGWRKSLPKEDRDRIAGLADEIMVAGAADFQLQVLTGKGELIGKDKAASTRARKAFCAAPDEYAAYRTIVVTSYAMRQQPAERADEAAAHMERLAKMLPVWEWARHIDGFAAPSLAVIVAEAGDLGEYPKKGHLWKRMGVAVIGEVRQGGLPKSAPKEAWIEHGYSRVRRSRMWNIGDSLIKGNGDGPYRAVYLRRKDYERKRAEAAGLTVVPTAKIPKGRAHEFMSVGHIHLRAQRYMEKRLLKDLWQAWRDAEAVAKTPVLKGQSRHATPPHTDELRP